MAVCFVVQTARSVACAAFYLFIFGLAQEIKTTQYVGLESTQHRCLDTLRRGKWGGSTAERRSGGGLSRLRIRLAISRNVVSRES